MSVRSDQSVGVLSVLRANAAAMLVAAGATVAVQLVTFVLAAGTLSPAGAVITTLLVSLLWVVIAAPVFAAGGRTILDGLLRGGAVLDSSIVVLIVLVTAGGGAVGPLGAVKIYLIWCSLVLAGCSVVFLARRLASRHILAGVVIIILLVVAAGPFWTNTLILSAGPVWQGRIAFVVRAFNPVFATAGCLDDSDAFVWNESPVLYEYTVLGRHVPSGAVAWYFTVGAWAVIAALICIAGASRHARFGDTGL